MEVGDGIAANLFPDETFSFPISDQFMKNFCGSFIPKGKLFDTSNFKSKVMTALFLNQMVTTISDFLCATKKTSLKPLHYFSSIQSDTPLSGHPAKVKPNILIVFSLMVVFRKEASDGQMSISLLNILKKRSLCARCLKQHGSKPT